MSYVERLIAHCDICGHEWITYITPTHCAKCKSRRWDWKNARETK
jgi:predicted Zn-ribbon and HTH transcriptional regulator